MIARRDQPLRVYTLETLHPGIFKEHVCSFLPDSALAVYFLGVRLTMAAGDQRIDSRSGRVSLDSEVLNVVSADWAPGDFVADSESTSASAGLVFPELDVDSK